MGGSGGRKAEGGRWTGRAYGGYLKGLKRLPEEEPPPEEDTIIPEFALRFDLMC